MKHDTRFWNTKDKKRLFAQIYSPDNQAEKTILLVHGLHDHSQRYHHLAEFFTGKGYNFISFDLRGHGKSSGRRVYARSLQKLLDDVDLAYNKSLENFPGTKLILYGHDIGGTLVLNYIIRFNKPIAAMIVSSPWLKLSHEPSWSTLILASWLKKVAPGIRMNFIRYHSDHLTHDPEVLQNVEKDPLVHSNLSLGLYFVLRQASDHSLRNVYKINYPFLLMHGGEDAITSAKASELYVMNTSDRTRLKIWEGMYHELHNELQSEEVLNYVWNWLKNLKL